LARVVIALLGLDQNVENPALASRVLACSACAAANAAAFRGLRDGTYSGEGGI
jgi:hypothetical protein